MIRKSRDPRQSPTSTCRNSASGPCVNGTSATGMLAGGIPLSRMSRRGLRLRHRARVNRPSLPYPPPGRNTLFNRVFAPICRRERTHTVCTRKRYRSDLRFSAPCRIRRRTDIRRENPTRNLRPYRVTRESSCPLTAKLVRCDAMAWGDWVGCQRTVVGREQCEGCGWAVQRWPEARAPPVTGLPARQESGHATSSIASHGAAATAVGVSPVNAFTSRCRWDWST